jgi:nucleotide-binding universal stress UspA family protein
MQPFRTILFAADFSENSREAFRAACSLALENKTRLFVLHVAAPGWTAQEPINEGEPSNPFQAGGPDQSRHEALKQKLREVYVPRQPLDVEYQTSAGDPPDAILRMAREIGSDLIVMGTHGLTSLRRLLVGSVAVAVLRGARCPVLALRSGGRPGGHEQIRLILHPTDFSAGAEAARRVARSLARDHGARLVLLHVVPLPVLGQAEMTAALDVGVYSDALEATRELVDGPDLKYPVETSLARGPAPEEIVRVGREIGCDLIVMGTHGRTGLGRLLMGNTAESVLPEAHCPVIILKSPWEAAATKSSAAAGKQAVTVS